MENLIFSLNATVPVFLMMILGLVFKKIGWIDDIFASKMNKFVFQKSGMLSLSCFVLSLP